MSYARKKQRIRRRDGQKRVELEVATLADPQNDGFLVSIDKASEGRAEEDPAAAQAVKTALFAGLTIY